MNKIIGEPDGATPLDPDELQGLKFKHIKVRRQLDELEQINIIDGMKWLKKQKNADVISEEFTCLLHTKLFGKVWQWAGKFRKTERNIGCDPLHISVNLRNLFDDAKFWIENKTFSNKEIATRFHHRLVAIHPFPNGNGRHSRIMADAILTHVLKDSAIDWSSGKSLQAMSAHRTNYISALRKADAGDMIALLIFTGALLEEQ